MSQIKSRTASAEDALYTAQQARAQTIRAIEVVTSHYPAGRFDVRRSFPGQPRGVPAGLRHQEGTAFAAGTEIQNLRVAIVVRNRPH